MDTISADLDREVDVVLGAIRLVASGGARRTIVAGLCSPTDVLAIAGTAAAAAGVVLEPLPRRNQPGIDILVRRRSDPPEERGG